MKHSVFINVFRNRLLVDNIIKYLPYSPKYSYELPKTYFFYNSNLRNLDYDEFFIYMVFFYGMENILYRYKKKAIIDILRKRNIFDVASENNEFKMIKKIYNFCDLSCYSNNFEKCFTSNSSLYSAIKHKNIELLKFLSSDLNTKNTKYDEYLSLSSVLNFSMMIGNLDIVKFICYKMKPFTDIIDRPNLVKLEIAIEEAIKYDNIECAFFLIDFFCFKHKKIKLPELSYSLKERIKTKTSIINDHIFSEYDIDTIIDWWYINFNINKTSCTNFKNYLEKLKYNKDMKEKEKAEKIISYVSKLLETTITEYNIYIITNNGSNGYLTNKKQIFNNIIRDVYYKPLYMRRKKDINLYKEYIKLYKLIK